MRPERFETDAEAAFACPGWNLGDDWAVRGAPWTTAADGPIPFALLDETPDLRDPMRVADLPIGMGPVGPDRALGDLPPGTPVDLCGCVARTTGIVGDDEHRTTWALLRFLDRKATAPAFLFVGAVQTVRVIGFGAGEVQAVEAAEPSVGNKVDPPAPLPTLAQVRLDALRAAIAQATGTPPGSDAWTNALQALGEARFASRGDAAIAAVIEEEARAIPDAGLDCRACGLCCAPRGGPVMTINLSQAEGARVEALYPGSIRPYEGNEVRLARLGEVAPAEGLDPDLARGCLFYAPGDAAGPCSIYPDRPDVCREFPPGCVPCRKVRRAGGLDPAPAPTPAPETPPAPVDDSADDDLPDILPALLATMRERPFPLDRIPRFREALLDAALDLDGDDLAAVRRAFARLGEAQVDDVNVRTARFVDALGELARLVHSRALRSREIPSPPA